MITPFKEEYFTFPDINYTQVIRFELRFFNTHTVSNFTYDSNQNISEVTTDYFDFDTGVPTGSTTFVMTYDSSNNAFNSIFHNSPVQLFYDASLMHTNMSWNPGSSMQVMRWLRYCPNNPLIITGTHLTDPVPITFDYTYNGDDYPVTVVRDRYGIVEEYHFEYY
ncbi:MAG: hypothetical protein HRT68_10265 [Flavobacteriaceae bacterium]|nr:hypothetical protein [Flavobacteriaceae bacterium]